MSKAPSSPAPLPWPDWPNAATKAWRNTTSKFAHGLMNRCIREPYVQWCTQLCLFSKVFVKRFACLRGAPVSRQTHRPSTRLCGRLLFIVHLINSCVITKFSSFQIVFNYFFSNFKVNHHTTSFHCSASNASTVNVPKSSPS